MCSDRSADAQGDIARCTLCSAACGLEIVPAGPDAWRSEPPTTEGAGLCPRGSVLGQLLGHHRRILSPAQRVEGNLRAVDLAAACQAVLVAAAGREIIFCIDAGAPCEQLVAAAAWCGAWPQATLCVAMEPGDRELLLGTEAGPAEYLPPDEIAECDGFLLIGDVFAANPACSRGVFEARAKNPRMPIVSIDPAGGTASKFASHRVDVPVGGELAVLSAVAEGQELAGCTKLGVLVTAEYARGAQWRKIGYAASQLAADRGGGIAPQTDGANALGAVRLMERLGAIDLGEAMSRGQAALVVVGCDVVGMVGGTQASVIAAAAGLPNCSTDAAQIVLPTCIPPEMAGTIVAPGQAPMLVSAAMAGPAGVPDAAEIIAAIAEMAGIAAPDIPSGPGPLERLDVKPPPAGKAADGAPSPALVLAREAMAAGCGALTGHGSWQAAGGLPELRISPGDARAGNIRNFSTVTVEAGGRSCAARVRIAPELADGVMVLPAGSPQARALAPCKTNGAPGMQAAPAAAEVIG